MNNKIRIVFFLVLFFQVALAQEKKDSVFANLNLTFQDKPLELNKEYVSGNKDTLQLTVFKFYISNLKLEYADKTTYSEPEIYHLIDIENPNSCKIPIENIADKAISRVSFSIGVDSLASVSGALEGDLDPTRGMYWAWQSGYINMKLEGRSSSCKTRKNEFQFHIGGYMKPNYAMRKVVLEPKKSNSTVKIDVDVAALFSQLELSKINSVMVPCTKAMQIANYSVTMFKTE
jgi:hypothetical protein